MSQQQQQHIVVIGAGVIGLSCALHLQSAGYAVTIVARDLPAPFETICLSPRSHINYASPWAGAHNRWVPPTPSGDGAREHAMAVATYARMAALAAAEPAGAATGITFMKGIEYLEAPPAEYLALTPERAVGELGMPAFRLLAPSEFPDERVVWGCEYDTWCVNPMVYCCFLLRRFVWGGGRVVRRELKALAEVYALDLGLSGGEKGRIDAAVNASGVGFGDDDKVFITRGQTCVVANSCAATVTRQNADGSWTFSVPRNFDGGTVIGGTKEPDNWDADPSPQVRESLLRSFTATHPAILGESGELRVLQDIVGRRPTRRGGPRIEGEIIPGGGFVMHAYGLGGRGFELSWGVAQGVLDGVQRHLKAHQAKL
ncbi:hypothetical protein B0T17DRAFT_615792 [Bombardia bombarda]|uniref:FAD dependent oxidoreductase domain-containing protein n=1 Tax=Bombardia bombarda TaxID=252184 RepID=A0AA40C9J6_9PEZI|nr:hypothetical protein B0T17DRAFT_615792 [Bombardia bombarda]